jgi:23S rRNA G2069 N7-methylase RlmK/C1962 C5-methylase RlmI
MIEIAKNELKVKTNDIYKLDASEALKIIIEEEKKYDLVLIDVY